jgi:two-component system, chemotaxis family, sensor kinase Cph1
MQNEITRPLDLPDCNREPIHVPGFIQQFGVLLAMSAGSDRISQISANTDLIFGVEPLEVVGQKLSQLLGEANSAEITTVLQAGNWKEFNPLKLTIHRNQESIAVNAIVHRYDGLDILELEPISGEHSESARRSYQTVQSALTRLQQSFNSPDLWDTVVSEAHRITGFDRVMLYKFDRDDHGHVIAEHRKQHHQPFLGLHYPASDIPEQARRLYRENWTRYIPDIHYKPVPIIPVVDEDHMRLTDLTYSVLRSVSPIHCEYLHNMGVGASMSVSVIRDGRLWGLIACHNDTPRHIPYELRAACELLGQVLSIRIAALEDTEDTAYKSKTNALQARFLAELPQYPNLPAALVSQSPNLLSFIPATGAAVCFGQTISVLGLVPTEEQIRLIVRSTLERIAAPIFVTDRLQDRVMEAAELTDTASGVLCFTVSRAHNFHILWFRAEQVRVMQWGGEPTKPLQFDEQTQRLSPRKSFEIWKQEVRGKSQAWSQPEIEAAAELRATLMSLLLTRQGA